MCERKTGTVRVSFDIASDDLADVLRHSHRTGLTSRALYRRAVAEYLVNHADLDHWPVGDDLIIATGQDYGSAPMDVPL